jgi:hypothetical protein
LFVIDDRRLKADVRRLMARIPLEPMAPLRIVRAPLHDTLHAGSFLRDRCMTLHCTRAELPRIFVHELFHFAWIRLGNPARHGFERVLADEYRASAAGELGWSAEWRKRKLRRADVRDRTRRWREYCCESFCDTAAWLYSGIGRHEEFTLDARFRPRRRAWFDQAFDQSVGRARLSI